MYEDMVIMGILEESKTRNTFKILKDILKKSNYFTFYENKKNSIIILNKDNKNIMIIDISSHNIKSIDDLGFEFHILIHTFLKPGDYHRKVFEDILKKSRNIILNCDENKWTNLLKDNKESIVITYGFNNKSTINPSSYNIQYSINANICFQREVVTIKGKTIEPFEVGMEINSIEKHDIYSGMAALTAGLILGIDYLIIGDIIEFNI